jgi:hypothetical protein
VVGVRRHASADHLIVRQPDHTLALLPAWMTKTNGSSCDLIQHPRLPLEKLAELHALVGTLLISLRGDSPSTRGAGDDERATQPKRFIRTSNDASELPSHLRTALTPLLRVLLTEAAAQGIQAEIDDRIGEEDGDDQDHA